MGTHQPQQLIKEVRQGRPANTRSHNLISFQIHSLEIQCVLHTQNTQIHTESVITLWKIGNSLQWIIRTPYSKNEKDNLLNSLHQIKFSCVFSPMEVLVRVTWKMGLTNPIVVVVDWGVLRRLCYVSSVRLALERVILMSLLICDVFSALILHPSLPLAIFSHLNLRFVFILRQQ